MSGHLTADWIQVAAGSSAALGVLFLATGIYNDEKDKRYTAPGLVALGAAVGIGITSYYLASVFVPEYYPLLRQQITLPILTQQTVISDLTLYFSGVGLLAGYIAGFRTLQDKNTQWLRENSSFWKSSLLSLIVWGIMIGILTAVAAFVLPAPTSTTIGVGVVLFLLSRFSYTCAYAAIFASARVLRVVGLLLSFVSIALVLIPPICDLLGIPIN